MNRERSPARRSVRWNRRGEGDRIVATGNVSCWMEARHACTGARSALVCASFGFIRSLTHARARARARDGHSFTPSKLGETQFTVHARPLVRRSSRHRLARHDLEWLQLASFRRVIVS